MTKIMIVEDETALVTLLKYNLEKQGYETVVVMDGKDLLIYHHVDRDGNTARSYLDVEEICHVYVRDSLEDKIYIRDFME